MPEAKFYFNKCCNSHVEHFAGEAKDISCCGEPMKALTANTTDASQEKHVPVIEINGNLVTVKIGSIEHPMVPEHHIEWLYLECTKGIQRKPLAVDGQPQATFALTEGDKAVRAYAYCNLHGLWTADV